VGHCLQRQGIPLSSQHVTAAELLKKHGYQTAAFIGAVILDSNTLAPDLDRGFDFYDNFPKTDSKDGDSKNTDGTKKERWGRVERRGMEVVEHAESWFEKHRTGPHFVWVHLFDPRDPYEPPPPFSEKYKDHLYAQIQQSDFAGALPDLEAFTKADPRNAAALRLLARAYRGLGREQDAKRTAEQAGAPEKK
jgi:arylsulfatase A-like enzyme